VTNAPDPDAGGVMAKVVGRNGAELKTVFDQQTRGYNPREVTLAMARQLEEIARRDGRWFRAHPERRHRCRGPAKGEFELFESDRGARLVMTIHHLGRGHVVYQPAVFQGAPPGDEESAAALFALAVRHPEPIPFIDEIDVLRLRRGVPQQHHPSRGA
jgi:hypothetical protein